VLIVGAKLQHIILDLAIEIRGGVEKLSLSTFDDMDDDFKKADEAIVVQPMKPRDDLFWFKRPRVLIQLIHFILFQVRNNKFLVFFVILKKKLRKCRDIDHLKFGEALYFYILPSIGPRNTFQLYLCTFSSNFGDSIHILNRNGNFMIKKVYFYIVKSRGVL